MSRMQHSLVIKNGRLVNEGTVTEGDLAIAEGRISQVGGVASGSVEIDAGGAWIVPGMIDDQVHFREPGMEHKATIATESKAVLAGGITSYMEMPNCVPQTTNASRLEDKYVRAAQKSMTNYAFYLGATNENIEDIKSIDPLRACGIKVFMGASTGDMLVDDEQTLEAIFANAPILVATHCEDTPTILANERKAKERYGDEIPPSAHVEIRSAEACYKSSSLAVGLARKHGTKLHVLHLTSAMEMSLFDTGPIDSKRITAEVCAHHLFFNDSWYSSKGTAIKCNPSIKHRADQQALKNALLEDRIDVIATDHAPHTWEEKQLPFMEAPAGLPIGQHVLPCLIEHVKSGDMPIETIVHKTSHAPALLYDVKERGFLREGYWADVVVIDPEGRTVVDDETLYSKCAWSPFAGLSFASRLTHTIVNGNLVYANGEFVSDERGMPLEFER